MSFGADAIREERQRQIVTEGHTAFGDDLYTDKALAAAGAAYAVYAATGSEEEAMKVWPESWDKRHFKPAPYARRNLAKAGALIAAEYDRIERLALAMIDPAAGMDADDKA